MIFKELVGSNIGLIGEKEAIAFKCAMTLTDTSSNELSMYLHTTKEGLDQLLEEDIKEIITNKGTKINRGHIMIYLNIMDNVRLLNYYEITNLIW